MNTDEAMSNKKLDSAAGSRLDGSRLAKEAEDNKSIQTIKSSFKTPNVIVTDYKFTPENSCENLVHPILGTPEVRNIHEIDWAALKFAQTKEWSEVCQEHYDAIVKLGNAPDPSQKTPRMSKQASKEESGAKALSKRGASKAKVGLKPLKGKKKKKKRKEGATSSLVVPGEEDLNGESKRSRSKIKKEKKKEKKEKKKSSITKRGDTEGNISVNDESAVKEKPSSSRKEKKEKKHKDKKRDKSSKKKKKDAERIDVAGDSLHDSMTVPEHDVLL